MPRKGTNHNNSGAGISHGEKQQGRKSHKELEEDPVRTLYTSRVTDGPGYVAIAWSMKDGDDGVLMEQSKVLGKVSVYDADCAALVEGLTAAAEAGVKILHVYCNSHTLVNQVSGEWKSHIPKRTRRLRQILEKREQFELFSIERAENHQNVYTASLALEAIRKKRVEVFFKRSKVDVPASQNDDYSSGSLKNVEECPICVEKVSTTGVFRVKGCLHWFCVSCLTQHVEIRVKSNQVPVKCPQDCSNFINIDQCQNILSPELFEDYAKRLTEASIPESERLYCPFSDCSSFMSRPPPSAEASTSGAAVVDSAECFECHRLFCAECLVPWHADMTCEEYKRLPPGEREADDIKLKTLASSKKWQQCKKCRRMIELAYGCYHITCRCGHEFCYTCGAPWVHKRATCKCALWNEAQLLRTHPHGVAPVRRNVA